MLSSNLFKLSDTIQVLHYQNEIAGPVKENENLNSLHDVVFFHTKNTKFWNNGTLPPWHSLKKSYINLRVMNVCEPTNNIKFNENWLGERQ